MCPGEIKMEQACSFAAAYASLTCFDLGFTPLPPHPKSIRARKLANSLHLWPPVYMEADEPFE